MFSVRLSFFAAALISWLAASCSPSDSNITAKPEESRMPANNPKILIAYYSHSGKTRQIAEQIQEATHGTLFEIVPVIPYPDDYDTLVEQAKQEIQKGEKPLLAYPVENLASYDTIFVGTPNWWSTLAPPVTTFLSGNDLSGKTVVPFVTHGGGGVARCAADMVQYAPTAKFKNAIVVRDRETSTSAERVKSQVQKLLEP